MGRLLVTSILLGVVCSTSQTASAARSLLDVDYRSLIARADLDYNEPARRSEEGMPVGNGRMGSLVWTTPTQLKFQINRVDVFAADGRTVSFPEADSDFASGCGYVDISLVSVGEDVFAGEAFQQHLSLYDAVMTAQGRGVTARVLAWPHRDVMAVEIDDQRATPEPIHIDLRMLRYQVKRITGRNYDLAQQHAVEFQTAQHRATSLLGIADGRITLTQKYEEAFKDAPAFYDASAVAIGVIGRASKARYLNDAVVQLSAAPGQGKFTILIASAASFNPQADVAGLAIQELEAAAPKGFVGLRRETADWWRDFWAKGFVYLHSSSGQADFVEAHYTYFLYLMGSTSRGAYPPHFNGMLWRTTGDMSRWGSQFWSANTLAYYSNLMPANRLDLMDPLYAMYFNMKDACALAARQQWGSQGIWIPEICWCNGPEPLPENLVPEFQDLFLVRKPYEQRSKEFQWYAETKNRHASRWNFQADGSWDHGHFVVPTKASVQKGSRFGSPETNGIFGHCTHILSVASRIANLFYQRYQFTQDKNWLRDKAYPLIKGSAEFYRHFPNFQKGNDGKYHIHHVNSGESDWNTSDTSNEINAMRMIFPLAIHASEILGVDAELRPIWQEISDNLPGSGSGGSRRANVDAGRTARRGEGILPLRVAGILPANRGPGSPNAIGSRLGTGDAFDTKEQGRDALATRTESGSGSRRPRAYGSFVYGGPGAIEPIGPEPELKARFLGFNALNSFIDSKGAGGAQIFRNRLRLREGPGAIDAEHIGGLSMGIHETMLESSPASVTNDEPIRIFNDWPKDWDAAFSLRARGAFLVSSVFQNGKIPLVEIHSQVGGPCRLANPWSQSDVTLYRNGKKAEDLSGATLVFPTGRDETVVVVPKGSEPLRVRVL